MTIAPPARAAREPDEFGLDCEYIARWSKVIFPFLCDHYWRIEVEGMEHVLRQGAAVLAGIHRGFVPWDAIMALYLIRRATGRVPRFLSHPGLFRFRLIADFVVKMGGVLACRESAARVLKTGQLLGVYPEGARAAFSRYRDAYTLKSFGRHDFVKMALSHSVPILPFVNVGSAEALPVFAQIKSRHWTRYADWPCIPISTFPMLPVPLPSKWHIRFLPPVDCTALPDNEATAKQISHSIREQMQRAIDEMLRRRRSIFFGSVFDGKSRHQKV
jgi:1-acyl-sn-glycerol-3-phosphate acyltransferase